MGSWRRALTNVHRILSSSAALNRTSVAPLSNTHTDALLRPQYLGFRVSRYSTTCDYNVDLSNEESKRRLFNRLVYRSKQRGIPELDLLFGKWVEEHIHSMDETGIKSLIEILDLETPDLWRWLTDQDQPPSAVYKNPVFTAVREKINENLNVAAPETRAPPGQPWVRGWGIKRKDLNSPIGTLF